MTSYTAFHTAGQREWNWSQTMDPMVLTQSEILPLASTLRDIDIQSSSPLYCNIPQEIRNLIFEFAFTPYVPSSPPQSILYPSTTETSPEYPQNTHYTRPGYTAKTKISLSLLRVSRRTYLETFHLPPKFKEHVFWHPPSTSPPERGLDEEKYFARFRTDQLDMVKEVHLMANQSWLESGEFERTCQLKYLSSVQKLKVTMRYCDWHEWERNGEVSLVPWEKNTDDEMDIDDEDEEKERNETKTRRSWGDSLRALKGLREFEMELEMPWNRAADLQRITDQALTWRFPMNDGRMLKIEPSCLKKETWEGPLCAWSDFCPHCCGIDEGDSSGKDCLERQRRKRMDLGPVLHVVSLRWRIVG